MRLPRRLELSRLLAMTSHSKFEIATSFRKIETPRGESHPSSHSDYSCDGAMTDNKLNAIKKDESKSIINIFHHFEITLCINTVIAKPVSEAKRGVAISWFEVRYK